MTGNSLASNTAGVYMRRQKIINLANMFLIVILVFVIGCASDTRNRILDDSLKIYSSAIRWGDFLGATKFYKDPTLFSQIDFDRLKGVKVTGYDMMGGVFSKDGNQLKQAVRIRFYDTGVGNEKEIVDNQVWEYDGEREVWLLTSPMPTLL